jgi:YqaJ-like viral recombinase domain
MIPSSGISPHSDEWFEAKCGKLSSSECGKIFTGGRKKDEVFGQGALTYIKKKIGEYLTGQMKGIPETEAVLRGLSEEPYAIERYELLTGNQVQPSEFWIHNAIFCGTTDGQVIEDNSIIEVKCLDSEKHAEICTFSSAEELKDFDFNIYSQVQSNILIADASHGDFISYDDRMRLYDLQIKIIRVYPDFEWQKEFEYRIGEVAVIYMNKIEQILKTPERNLQYARKQLELTA